MFKEINISVTIQAAIPTLTFDEIYKAWRNCHQSKCLISIDYLPVTLRLLICDPVHWEWQLLHGDHSVIRQSSAHAILHCSEDGGIGGPYCRHRSLSMMFPSLRSHWIPVWNAFSHFISLLQKCPLLFRQMLLIDIFFWMKKCIFVWWTYACRVISYLYITPLKIQNKQTYKYSSFHNASSWRIRKYSVLVLDMTLKKMTTFCWKHLHECKDVCKTLTSMWYYFFQPGELHYLQEHNDNKQKNYTLDNHQTEGKKVVYLWFSAHLRIAPEFRPY